MRVDMLGQGIGLIRKHYMSQSGKYFMNTDQNMSHISKQSIEYELRWSCV